MSQYHYGGGSQRDHGAYSSPYPSAPGQTPPNPHPASDPIFHSQVTHQAYSFNQLAIPGLGFGPVARPGLDQMPMGHIPWPGQHVGGIPLGHQAYSGLGISTPVAAQGPISSAQPASTVILPQRELDNTREEGELSEGDDDGEFEDLYEPRPTHQSSISRTSSHVAQTAGPTGGGPPGVSQPDGVNGLRESSSGFALAMLDRVVEHSPQPMEPLRPVMMDYGRARSGSYSPYLSPKEMHHVSNLDRAQNLAPGLGTDSRRSINGNASHGASSVLEHHSSPNEERAVPSRPSVSPDDLAAVSRAESRGESPPGGSTSAALSSFHSVADAKKKAQAAILNLLPFGIRAQAYVDEGIDAAFVKHLFADMGLEPTPSSLPPRSTSQASSVSQQAAARPSPGQAAAATSPLGLTSLTPADEATPVAAASEERKDRIKRLLAQKAAENKTNISPAGPGAAASLGAPDAVQASSPANIAPSASSANQQSQKNILLQQRMEALKKMQGRSRPASVATRDVADPTRDDNTPGLSTTTETDARPHDTGKPVVPDQPHVLLSSNPPEPAPTRSQRKRPVASDFETLSSHSPAKRPFGQSREATLIIDISDGSDDEDMEMEMASPTEPPSLSTERPQPIRNTKSFRNHPPLAASGSRPTLSPAPGAKTPVGKNARMAARELQVYERSIEELKKRIAAVEAEKQREKASLVSSTNSNESPADTPRSGPVTLPVAAHDSTGSPASSARSDADKDGRRALPASSVRPTNAGDFKSGQPSAETGSTLATAMNSLKAKSLKIRLIRAELARLEKDYEAEEKDLRRMEAEAESSRSKEDKNIQPFSHPAESTMNSPAAAPPRQSGADASDPGSLDRPRESREPSESKEMDIEADDSANDVNIPEIGIHNDNSSNELAFTNSRAASLGSQQQAGSPAQVAVNSSDNAASFDTEASRITKGNQDAAGDALSPSKLTNDGSGSRPGLETLASLPEPSSPVVADGSLSMSDSDERSEIDMSPVPEHISARVDGLDDTDSVSDGEGDGDGDNEPIPTQDPDDQARGTVFVPYQSPLSYFRAFRFHPQFRKLVPGGLRSMTYSNKIDTSVPWCPTDLTGDVCPKGSDCEYQHFVSMILPDDQILLQLGGSGDFVGEKKQQYINGLRDLLFNFRTQKIRDFDIIAQAIIDYRAKFSGDALSILPLGDVSL